MVKIWVEICLISARGVRASHSLWKRQWYAIGWIDPNNKYITKVDASTNTNPLWRTKFSIQVDNSEPNFQDLALNVEVYSRDPFFFTEKLHGSATVLLKEFLAKQLQNGEGNEEVGSYQLRKKKSNKPRGFVDVSIRVSEDKEEPNSHSGRQRPGPMQVPAPRVVSPFPHVTDLTFLVLRQGEQIESTEPVCFAFADKPAKQNVFPPQRVRGIDFKILRAQ
ncbi:calcium-dependent lipid-binding (CaLB domain) family protein [Trifolium pratense]|uniref:Calcium-dependent lipid-binding (CaLB domain) family protein n=1 Tax=Trifolium pratense TaxID=57577 RepID=A0A2K3P5L3_TRIPR|nr:calcium-dependent lipid-binding (CaLB domain) family protein [Trifolium pratense]